MPIKRYTTSSDGIIVLKMMNQLLKLSRGFQAHTKRTRELEIRISEHGVEIVLDVIVYIFAEWRNWNERDRYFNPTTLFRKSNFDRYLEDFLIFQEQEQKNVLKTAPNERKQGDLMGTIEEYIRTVLGHSEYARTHYMRLSHDGKKQINEYLNKCRNKGILPERASIIKLLQKVA